MFSNLFGKKKQEVHPLSTESGIQMLLKGLPRDDLGFLGGVDHLLESIPECMGEIGLADCLRAALRIDQTTRAVVSSLLRNYLDPESDRYLSNALQDKLSYHVDSLCAVYGMVAGEDVSAVPDTRRGYESLPPDILRGVGTEFFSMWGLGRRLTKFRYRRPGADSWQRAHAMLRCLSKCGVLATDAVSIDLQPDNSIFREYLNVVYVALAPVANLAPQQLEFVANMVAEAESLDCLSEPDDNTTHVIDMSGDLGPIPYKPDYWAADGAVLRYLSVSSLRPVVERFHEALKANTPLPKRFASLPISRSQVAGVLSSLKIHWTNEPPSRSNDRISSIEAMRGALGFVPALRLVEISEKARSDEPTSNNPHSELLNRLWHLEEQIESNKFEDWVQIDGNDEGLGVTIPAILSRHVAGSLVSMRYADEPGWHLGLIRRVGLDSAGKPRLGLHIFPGTPKIVQVHLPNKPHAGSGVKESREGGFKAIACESGSNQLLIPTGMYAENLELDFSIGSVKHHVCLTGLIESGPDYELVEFAELKQ